MLKICPVNYVSWFGGVFPPTLTCRTIHTRKQKLPLLYLKLASYLYIKDNTNDFKDSEIMQRNKKKIKKKRHASLRNKLQNGEDICLNAEWYLIQEDISKLFVQFSLTFQRWSRWFYMCTQRQILHTNRLERKH